MKQTVGLLSLASRTHELEVFDLVAISGVDRDRCTIREGRKIARGFHCLSDDGNTPGLRRGRSSTTERIQQNYPAASEIGCVSCHIREAMQERNRGDLLVDPMLRIRHPQPPPHLGGIAIQAEHTIAEIEQHLLQSLLQELSLLLITLMTVPFNTTSQLTDRHCRLVATCLCPKCYGAWIGPPSPAGLADHVRVNQKHLPVQRCRPVARNRHPVPHRA